MMFWTVFLDNFNTQAYNAAEDAMITANRNYLSVSDNSALRSSNSETSEHEASSSSTGRCWEVELIEEVRSYPCLWNTTSRSFKETPKEGEAWRRISASINISGKYSFFVSLYTMPVWCMVVSFFKSIMLS